MAFDTGTFFIDYIKQLNLSNMDDATRERLKYLKDNHVATDKQNTWDPTKPLPECTDATYGGTASVNDLKELYLKMVLIMRDIHADRDMRENAPTKKFLETFYGAGKAVEPYTIAPLSGTDAADIANYISSNKDDFVSFFNDELKESDLEKLIDTLNDGSYVSNTKTLKNLDKFLSKLTQHYRWGSDKELPSTNIPACLGSVTPATGTTPATLDLNVSSISNIQKHLNAPILPTDYTNFNAEMPKLFGKLLSDDKLREKFTSKDAEGDITYWLNKGLSESNYKEGDNALAPKYKDRKRFWKDAQDKLKENYVETVGKLSQKHKRHKYSTNARFIVEELINKGVKPTDGTEKILETFDAINGNLPNPVQKQLKWIKETMTKMKETDFFKDALKDGTQMRQLVSEIIKAAAHDDKEEAAELALETLAVMRYTMTTSSIRDSLRKTEVSIFSDPGLSWNKNEGMKVVSGALDKMIKYGTMALFEVGNFAKNAIRQNGLKFKKGTGRLGKRITDSVEYTDTTKPEKRKMMERLFARWDFFNSSANTKDYNIFRLHKDVQKDANEVDPATGKTKIQQRFEEYYASHNIGR